MALTNVNFSCSQAFGDLETLSIEDTSTGTDVSLTNRKIYIRLANGSYLSDDSGGDYIEWDISDDTKDIQNILDKDYALEIRVDWCNGSTVVYTKTNVLLFTGYSDTFLLNLTRWQTSNQQLVNSANYWSNKSKLRCLVDDAEQAIEQGNDQTAAQICLDLAKQLTDNQENFY